MISSWLVRVAAIIGMVASVSTCIPHQPSRVSLLRYATIEASPRLLERIPREETKGRPWMALHSYPKPNARGVVVLVSGLGTNAHVWDLPGSARLAREIWRAGFWVYTVDQLTALGGFRDGVPFESDAHVELAHLSTRVRTIVQAIKVQHQDLPLVGIGHDIGGWALYGARAQGAELDGIVGIGAPFVWSGATRAFRMLLQLPKRSSHALSWRSLANHRLPAYFAGSRSYERVLLTSGMPHGVRDMFYAKALAAMPAKLLLDLGEAAGDEPIPHVHELTKPHEFEANDAWLAAFAQQESIPLLAVMSPQDGVAPPWQCDPVLFGLRAKHVTRAYVTQSSGASREYNHLDLVTHPDAVADVFPTVIDWLMTLSQRA